MPKWVIALDAMGGDQAPQSVLGGAEIALQTQPGLFFQIFGNETEILPIWEKMPALRAASEIFHTSEVIAAGLKPTQALRSLKQSSMRLAVEAVAAGNAQAVVSAGNTGAYVALSKLLLRMIPGIDRPALPVLMPTTEGMSILLDAGANLHCDAENLVQFALMGSCFARILLQKETPTVGLLNIGSEESKGHATLQEAAQHLRDLKDVNFIGYIEGSDVNSGAVDVVVTDGFSGNLVLKSIEGAAHFFTHLLRESLTSSWRGRLGALVARPSLRHMKAHLDPRLHNGTLFLGLKGLAVKSHGGMDAIGMANAIQVAARMIQQGLIHDIIDRQKEAA